MKKNQNQNQKREEREERRGEEKEVEVESKGGRFEKLALIQNPLSSFRLFPPFSSCPSLPLSPTLPLFPPRGTAHAKPPHTLQPTEKMTTEAVKAAAPAVEDELNGIVAEKKKAPSADGAPAAAAPSSKKSVPKPDEVAMKVACDELAAKIDKNKQRLEQIKTVLADRAEKKKTGGSPAMQALKERLACLREQFKTELVSSVDWRARTSEGEGERVKGEGAREDVSGRFPSAPFHRSETRSLLRKTFSLLFPPPPPTLFLNSRPRPTLSLSLSLSLSFFFQLRKK